MALGSGFAAVSGTINRATLSASYAALAGHHDSVLPQFEPLVRVDSMAMRAFQRTFEQIHRRIDRTIDDNDLMFPLLEEMMAYQLLGSWPRKAPRIEPAPPLPTSSASVRRAMAYIAANLAKRLTLAEVAAVAG